MFTYLCKPYRAFSFVCAASVLTSTLMTGSANAEVPASPKAEKPAPRLSKEHAAAQDQAQKKNTQYSILSQRLFLRAGKSRRAKQRRRCQFSVNHDFGSMCKYTRKKKCTTDFIGEFFIRSPYRLR